MAETQSAPSLRELSERATLDERMKAAGMFTVAEMMGATPMTRWEVHAGMTDLDFFGKWLDMKVSEYLRMRAVYDLGDKDESDELYEWVLAHSAVFSSIRTNFRAAFERSTTKAEVVASARAEGWQPIETAPKDGQMIGVPGGCAFWHPPKQCWVSGVGGDSYGREIQWPVTHWICLTPGGRTDG